MKRPLCTWSNGPNLRTPKEQDAVRCWEGSTQFLSFRYFLGGLFVDIVGVTTLVALALKFAIALKRARSAFDLIL